MKKVLTFTGAVLVLASLFLFSVAQAASSDHFVIEVTITDGGDTTFTIPTFPGETYNYDVDWDNDQTFEDTANTGDATHDFTTTGTYTVRIDGTFPRIYFNNTGDKLKLTDVSQWGTGTWTSMGSAFYGATNLEVTATDEPNLSSVTDMSYMFANVDALDQDLGDWDVSNVTDMSYLFYDADGLQGNVGTFLSEAEYAGPDGAQATNAGDLNNDGYPDFIVNGTGFKVYLNDGDGTFTASALYNEVVANSRSADLADINGDGYLDYILPSTNASVNIFYNNGDGTFGSANTITGVGNNLGATAGDLNDDGHLDIVTAHWSGGSAAVILNNGDGTFAAPVEYAASAVGTRKISIADFDDDGYNDMVITVDGAPGAFVFINDGDGTFANYVVYTLSGWSGYSTDTDVADVDLDGDIDIAVTSHGSCQYFGILLNDGDGTFSAGSNVGMNCSSPDHVELGDVNGDGYPDAVVGNLNTNNVNVFLNNGAGGFSSLTAYFVGGDVQTLALADFDQDGTLDIVAPDANNDKASVFLNKSLHLNLWDTSSVTTMAHMFDGAGGFNQSVAAWNVANVTDMTDMFNGVTLSTDTYDDMLLEWYDQDLKRDVTFDAGNSKYCAGVYAQANLTTRYAWSITDGGADADYTCIPVAISTGYLGGGATSHLQSSCTPSATIVEIGDEVSFTIDIDTTEDDYEFEWTKVLSGDDEDETYTFDTAGTFYPRAQVRTTNLGTHTVNCGTITVTESDDTDEDENDDGQDSTSTQGDDSDENDSDEQSEPTSTTLEALVSEHRTFLLGLQASGITLPANVTALLAQTTTNTTSFTFTRDLELDMTGPDVTALQQLLIAQGYAIPAGATGYFGAQTQTALIQFQIAKGIVPAVGYFGAVTRVKVNAF
jgi:surface protein